MGKILSPAVHLFVTLAWMIVAYWMIFLYAPQELTMGEMQRISYIHAPSGWVAGTAYCIVFLGSVIYLMLA